MSGSFWRGTQLRIAEAKPKWDIRCVAFNLAFVFDFDVLSCDGCRIKKEMNPAPELLQAAITKKRKRSAQIASREGFGKLAQDSRLPTEHNHTTKKVRAPCLACCTGED